MGKGNRHKSKMGGGSKSKHQRRQISGSEGVPPDESETAWLPCPYCTTGAHYKKEKLQAHLKRKHPLQAKQADSSTAVAKSEFSEDDDTEVEFTVEKVLAHKTLGYLRKGGLSADIRQQARENNWSNSYTLFQVKWLNYDDPTWEPRENLEENDEYISYLESVPEAKHDEVVTPKEQKSASRKSHRAKAGGVDEKEGGSAKTSSAHRRRKVKVELKEEQIEERSEMANKELAHSSTADISNEKPTIQHRQRQVKVELKEGQSQERKEVENKEIPDISAPDISNAEPPKKKKKFMSVARAEERKREIAAAEQLQEREQLCRMLTIIDPADNPKTAIKTQKNATPTKVKAKIRVVPKLAAAIDETKTANNEVKPEATKQVRPPLGPIPKEFTNESMRPILEDPQLVAWLERRTKPTTTLEHNRHTTFGADGSISAQMQARGGSSIQTINSDRILNGLQEEVEAMNITAEKRISCPNYPFAADDMTDLIRYQLAQMKNGLEGKKEMVVHFLSLSRNEHMSMVDRLEAAALVGDSEGSRFFQLFDQWLSAEKQHLAPTNTDEPPEEQEKAVEKLTAQLVQKLIEETTDRQTGVNLLMNLSWTRDKCRPCCSTGVPNQCRLLQFLSKYCGGKLLNRQTLKSKWTALMTAVNSGAPCQITALLQNDASVTMRDSSKRTALFMAVERRDLRLCQWLLWNGADPHVTATDPQIGRDCIPLTLAEHYQVGSPLVANWLIRRSYSIQKVIRDWVASVCKVSMRNYVHPLYPLLFWHSFRPFEMPMELETLLYSIEFRVESEKKLLEHFGQRTQVKPFLFIFAAFYRLSDEGSTVEKAQLKLITASQECSPSLKKVYVNGDEAQTHLKMSELENCWITTFIGLRKGSNTIQLSMDTSTMTPESRRRLILFIQPWACRQAIASSRAII